MVLCERFSQRVTVKPLEILTRPGKKNTEEVRVAWCRRLKKTKQGDQCPGQRTGRQDKPSDTEIYGVRVQSRGDIRIQVRGHRGRKGYIEVRNKILKICPSVKTVFHIPCLPHIRFLGSFYLSNVSNHTIHQQNVWRTQLLGLEAFQGYSPFWASWSWPPPPVAGRWTCPSAPESLRPGPSSAVGSPSPCASESN